MKVIIDGLHTADGEYEFDLAFTNRDLHELKQISGVRPAEFEEAFEAMDNDLVVAIAAIVLRKHGRRVPLDALWDAPLGVIRLDVSDVQEETQEADAGPPSQTPTMPGVSETLSGESSISGNGSSESSDRLVMIPPAIGVPTSGIGSPVSAPETSAT